MFNKTKAAAFVVMTAAASKLLDEAPAGLLLADVGPKATAPITPPTETI